MTRTRETLPAGQLMGAPGSEFRAGPHLGQQFAGPAADLAAGQHPVGEQRLGHRCADAHPHAR
jgi:hypothetical protein